MKEKQEAAAMLAKQQQDEAEQKLNQARETSGEVESENRRLRTEVGDLRETAQPQVVLQKLQKDIPPEEADIVMTGTGKILVRVKDLQFKSNSADLTPAAAAKLTKVRSALNDINPKKILIEGHTDSTGSAKKNMELSETRAESVATVLTAGENLKEADIETAGLGSEKPLKENRTKDGRKENRRVEITIETL
jgi:outer membrane protein OmpA-like peptidoglycan-associated protein